MTTENVLGIPIITPLVGGAFLFTLDGFVFTWLALASLAALAATVAR
jgi:hypothetical protein